MKETKAVIFDMDGVLIDSQPYHYKADIDSMKEFGLDRDQKFYEDYAGTTTPNRMKTLKEIFMLKAEVDDMVNRRESMILEIMRSEELIPVRGIPDLLKSIKAKGLKTAVESSSSYELIYLIVERLGISEYFDCITSGVDVKNGKPAPDVFLLAAEKIGVDPENCVVIEDSHHGVMAAVAAGMKSVGYVNPTSGNQCLDKANLIVDNFMMLNADIICSL